MVQKIDEIDEIKKARAASASYQDKVDYNEWSKVLEELNKNGIEPTGSMAADKEKLRRHEEAAQAQALVAQAQQAAQQAAQNRSLEDKNEPKETPSDQKVKETFATATSSQILDYYMRWQIT
ncbi:MAG: hypothetical protein LBK53_05845 [Heliobacteriaceae bacterium]|jgi:type IV secretory pathway VirB10-like protein|nr:hypothetical protein [Heliobacteriaceae bacterium]